MEIPQVLVWPHNQQLDMEVKVMDRPVDMLPSPAGDTRGPQCPRPKDTTHTEDRDICFWTEELLSCIVYSIYRDNSLTIRATKWL